jgi:hypothetical protein
MDGQFESVNPPSKTLADMKGPERERMFVRLTDDIAAALKRGRSEGSKPG